MPDISLPEVHLPDFKLPEGLRDVNREDIQKAMPDVRLPKMPRRSDISKELAKATKELEKAGRDLEKNLPRRPGPSPLPFVILGLLGGLVVGWLLASSPTTAPRISGLVDEVKSRINRWRTAAMDDGLDAETAAFRDPVPMQSDTYAGAMSEAQTGVGVGPGQGTNGVGATAGRVGSDR